MSVDKKTVRHVAKLSRLALAEGEAEIMAPEIANILHFVEQLNAVNVDGVEPLKSILPMALKMREDVVSDGDIQDQILKNAPASDDGYFTVPKVVE